VSAPRRLALTLMAHAARVFPSGRKTWAAAMQSEMIHIENDGEALRWSLGCVFTSYREKAFAMKLMQTRAARVLLAILLFYWTVRELFAPTHPFHDLGFVHAFLGSHGVSATNLNRFLPLADLTPWWLQALWTAAAVAGLLSAWALLRGRSVAVGFFLAAVAFKLLADMGAHLLDQWVPAYHQAALIAYAYPVPGLKSDVIVPAVEVLLFAGIAGALWLSVGRNAQRA
jgi:hypothetical protein